MPKPYKWPDHKTMVEKLFNKKTFPDGQLDFAGTIMHAAAGIAGEAGEVLELAKKLWANGRTLEYAKVREELGDVEFYLEALRQFLRITREETLAANMHKLGLRFPDGEYSHAAAKARADKAPSSIASVGKFPVNEPRKIVVAHTPKGDLVGGKVITPPRTLPPGAASPVCCFCGYEGSEEDAPKCSSWSDRHCSHLLEYWHAEPTPNGVVSTNETDKK